MVRVNTLDEPLDSNNATAGDSPRPGARTDAIPVKTGIKKHCRAWPEPLSGNHARVRLPEKRAACASDWEVF
jgi:hypothetical protein